jgi:hypothetical protein
MMTPFGRHEPLVPPSVAADDGITAFDEPADVMGSNLARGRPRLLNGTTFAELGAACVAGTGFPTVHVRGRIEMLRSRPEGRGSATDQEQNDSSPVPNDARSAGPQL